MSFLISWPSFPFLPEGSGLLRFSLLSAEDCPLLLTLSLLGSPTEYVSVLFLSRPFPRLYRWPVSLPALCSASLTVLLPAARPDLKPDLLPASRLRTPASVLTLRPVLSASSSISISGKRAGPVCPFSASERFQFPRISLVSSPRYLLSDIYAPNDFLLIPEA